MSLGLGIDTGGTYTDAVIYDFNDNRIVAVSKSLTTKHDLEGCISRTLDGLPKELLPAVKAVSLSTTLATNACIEGRGEKARLVLIGCDRKVAVSYGNEYGLPPAGEIIFLDGGHDQKGRIVSEPDWEFLRKEIEEHDNEYDSYAVVEIWGMNNCDYEVMTKKFISEWTGKRIVCGHELTAKLNLFKRAASALLNAQLIPLVSEFMDSIKVNLKARGIDAPLTIMRGDGSLMSEDFAREKPVETLLCGPAASIEGGLNLTDEKDCVIIDMGGTTSDMAIVRNSVPRIADEGAIVGKWRTGTHSILIETTGLGGDSRISFDSDYSILLGPERVEPVSQAAAKWPQIIDKAEEIYKNGRKYIFPLCEFVYSTKTAGVNSLFTERERRISKILLNNPMSISELSAELGASMTSDETGRLEKAGIITRIGLTPTDIMHLTGDYRNWDSKAAGFAAGAFAKQIETDVESLTSAVYSLIKEKLFIGISKLLIEDEDKSILSDGMSGQLRDVLLNGFRKAVSKNRANDRMHTFEATLKTGFSLVGIGAPIHIFLKDVAAAMQTRCIVPENAAVANAIGAITGKIRSEKTAVISPEYSSSGVSGYMVNIWGTGKRFKVYEDALEYAQKAASEEAMETNNKKGAHDTLVRIDISENKARPNATQGPGYNECGTKRKCQDCIGNSKNCQAESAEIIIETMVTAVAAGNPFRWERITV